MKKTIKLIGIIAIATVIGLSLVTCQLDANVGGKDSGGGSEGSGGKIYAIDVSGVTEDWDYWLLGSDKSSVFYKLSDNGLPLKMSFMPDISAIESDGESGDESDDESIVLSFRENGLPDKLVYDGDLYFFVNFRENLFDIMIIYPDGMIAYQYDIETGTDWDALLEKAELAASIGMARSAGSMVKDTQDFVNAGLNAISVLEFKGSVTYLVVEGVKHEIKYLFPDEAGTVIVEVIDLGLALIGGPGGVVTYVVNKVVDVLVDIINSLETIANNHYAEIDKAAEEAGIDIRTGKSVNMSAVKKKTIKLTEVKVFPAAPYTTKQLTLRFEEPVLGLSPDSIKLNTSGKNGAAGAKVKGLSPGFFEGDYDLDIGEFTGSGKVSVVVENANFDFNVSSGKNIKINYNGEPPTINTDSYSSHKDL